MNCDNYSCDGERNATIILAMENEMRQLFWRSRTKCDNYSGDGERLQIGKRMTTLTFIYFLALLLPCELSPTLLKLFEGNSHEYFFLLAFEIDVKVQFL